MSTRMFLICVAQVLGAIYFIFDIKITQQKDKETMIKYNNIVNSIGTLQYLCLGAWAGALCNLLAIGRNYVFSKFKNVPTYVVFLFITIAIIANIPNMDGVFAIIPIFNISITAIAVANENVGIFKLVLVITGLAGILYNLVSFAFVSVITSSIYSASAIIGYINYLKTKNQDNIQTNNLLNTAKLELI